jgi:hypothetical protein
MAFKILNEGLQMLHKDFCGYATVIEAAFNYNSSQYQRG